MRTHVIAGVGTTFPWLERFSPNSSAPEIIEVAEFPFTLGRNEDCDYQIISTRVSREHAEIIRTASGFALRDLGSTNGTFLNGQRIDQLRLGDGDLVAIADVELTFRVAGGKAAGKTVTQVIPSDSEAEEDEENVPLDLIQEVRARQEQLLCRGLRNHFQTVVDLTSGQPAGHEALRRATAGPGAERTADRILSSAECRLTERMHQLRRLLAAEQAAQIPQGSLLFLHLEAAEVGADLLPETLARLQALVEKKRLVAEVPDSAVVDIPYFRDFVARLRELGVAVAYDGFAGGQHQISLGADLAPDYLKLAPALARGVDKSTQRQQQILAIVEAASQRGTQVIATGVHTELEAQTCRELGCLLAQGDHYGRPQTLEWPAEGWHSTAL